MLVLLLPAAAVGLVADGTLRASRGLGRDTQCIEPPPPLRGMDVTKLAADDVAPPHLEYLGLDGCTGEDVTWPNLGFMIPQPCGPLHKLSKGNPSSNCWDVKQLSAQKKKGFSVMVNFQPFTLPKCRGNADCWREMFIGNATVGGLWNTTIEPVKEHLLGIYVGDELLGESVTIGNLTAIFDLCKAVWPAGVTYYNEEWTPINDPDWRDPEGQPYTTVPTSLDWISYDFYRFNNHSWLQPMCEYAQNLVRACML
jgi:hypothetical protein